MDRDFILVQRMRMGEEEAVEIFVTRYYPGILSYCQVHVSDRGYAEDITQETFERFFRTFNKYRHYGKAANYLYAIAANACRDYYRKQKEIVTEAIPEQEDRNAGNSEERVDVRIAFERLPEELREVAVLYFLQEWNIKNVQRKTQLRILSEDAVLETATLEDVFLHYFGERAGEGDVSI